MRLLLPALLISIALGIFTPGPAQAYQASVVFSGCTDEQQAVLRTGLARMSETLPGMIARFETTDLAPYLTAWFGSPSRAPAVREVYQKILDVINRPRSLVLACQSRTCEHSMFGYSQGNTVSVCPDFFKAEATRGYDSQAGTLIHEFSHAFAHTSDHAYGVGRARRLAHNSPKLTVDNADSYQYFYEALTGQDIAFGDRGWSDDNSCEWAYDGECDEPRLGTGTCPAATDRQDCAALPDASNTASTSTGKRPSFGPANPLDTCSSALNGTCDASCTPGSDYTDCLTGHSAPKNR